MESLYSSTFIGAVIIVALILFLALKKKQPTGPINEEIPTRYNFEIPYYKENTVNIEKLLIYPCRGIMGIEVDHVKVSKFGIKYDREWACFDKEKLGAIT